MDEVAFPDIVAIVLIAFGSIGIALVILGYLSIRKNPIFRMSDTLNDLTDTVEDINKTVSSASEFLATSTPILEGVSRIFYDIGGSLPLVGRSFRELGKNLGTMSDSMYTFKESIESFEEKWKASLDEMGSLREVETPSIKLIIAGLIIWLISLHLVLILVGIALLSL
ncbi:MAG: hypothetical protein SVY15_04450 [Halobacteriota archaeon]|nr:hypothetical protein [Halobacteriota archaeon]